jgi:hypothetical protein
MTNEQFEHLQNLFVEYDRIVNWCEQNSRIVVEHDMEKLYEQVKVKLRKDVETYIINM